MFEDLKKLSNTIVEAKKKMADEGKKTIKNSLKEFFSAFPCIESIQWTQYTPYFNDGDACEFGVNNVQIKFVDGFVNTGESEGHIDPEYELDELEIDGKLKNQLMKATSALDDNFDDMSEILKEAFGDHVEITVTKNEVTVESYDHE